MASCLQQWKSLDGEAKVTIYGNRNNAFLQFFTITNKMC